MNEILNGYVILIKFTKENKQQSQPEECNKSTCTSSEEEQAHASCSKITKVGNPNRQKMHIFGFVGIFEYIC